MSETGIISSKYSRRIPEIAVHEAVFTASPCSKTYLVDGESGKSYSYGEVEFAMMSIGSALTRMDIKKGDVVCFFAPNSVEYAIGVLGCFSIGAIFTGINNNYKPYELGHQLSDCKPKVIITTAASADTVKGVLEDDKYDTYPAVIVTIDTKVEGLKHFQELLDDDRSAFPKDLSFKVREDVACILYSSGTTGVPKGVMITHYNFTGCLTALREDAFNSPYAGSTVLFLPLFHMFGVLICLAIGCRHGRVVVLSGFKPDTFLKAIQDYKITHVYVVPPIVNFLAKHPLVDKYDVSSVKVVLSGAAPLTADTERLFLDRFKLDIIYQGYGMTEATAATALMPYGKAMAGASGVIVPNIDIKIVDVKTREPVPKGQEGEILIRGPTVMKGYWNNPEANKTCLQDGWLLSGDVGYVNDEEYLFITGRVKELIKHKGFQVAPAELEGLLLSHPGVMDVAVIGMPDEVAGELPRAFVVKKDGQDISAEDISNFVQEKLSKHKWLTGGVQFVTNIPKTASGKIVRREVRKLYSEQLSS